MLIRSIILIVLLSCSNAIGQDPKLNEVEMLEQQVAWYQNEMAIQERKISLTIDILNDEINRLVGLLKAEQSEEVARVKATKFKRVPNKRYINASN